MAQKPNQNEQRPVAQAKAKSHALRNVGLVILGIIVVGGAYFYYEYLSGGIGGAVYAALTSGNPAQALQTAALQKLNSLPQFTLAYTGSITQNITVNNHDPVVTLPFHLSYLKYYNASRISASFSGLQGIGNESVVIIVEGNGTTVYACLNNGSGFSCRQSSGSAQNIEQNLSDYFGLSSLGNIQTGTPVPSYYSGMPCFQVQGTGTINGQTQLLQNPGNADVSFSACFSSNYYVPLMLDANVTQSGMPPVTLQLSVTNITTASNYSEVTNLPGQLVP